MANATLTRTGLACQLHQLPRVIEPPFSIGEVVTRTNPASRVLGDWKAKPWEADDHRLTGDRPGDVRPSADVRGPVTVQMYMGSLPVSSRFRTVASLGVAAAWLTGAPVSDRRQIAKPMAIRASLIFILSAPAVLTRPEPPSALLCLLSAENLVSPSRFRGVLALGREQWEVSNTVRGFVTKRGTISHNKLQRAKTTNSQIELLVFRTTYLAMTKSLCFHVV